jgi:hypothetical protein
MPDAATSRLQKGVAGVSAGRSETAAWRGEETLSPPGIQVSRTSKTKVASYHVSRRPMPLRASSMEGPPTDANKTGRRRRLPPAHRSFYRAKGAGKRKCAVRESNTGPVELGSFPLMGCSLATTDFTTKPTALAVAVVVIVWANPNYRNPSLSLLTI